MPSIRLDEDNTTPTLGTRPYEGGLTPMLGTDPGTPSGPTGQGQKPGSKVAAVTESSGSDPDWRKPIFEYLRLGAISDNETETWHLARRAKGYLIRDDELYHHSALGILQRCIPIEEGKALLLDIHEGIYGHHALSRSMIGKAFRQDFYWLTVIDDAVYIMRSCKGS
jgi:hypothetical protein